jgi:hypothetical protein
VTKREFLLEFTRLCEGHRYEPTPIQGSAYFERLQHVHAADWREAVTDLLCAPRFPLTLDPILATIEKYATTRRRREVESDRMKAERTLEAVGCGMPDDVRAKIFGIGKEMPEDNPDNP